MNKILPLGPASITQGVAALIVLAAVTGTPSSYGFMLVVPLFSTTHPTVIATRSGAVILGRGPLSGSWVIFGDRSRILPAALSSGSIILASGAKGCGGGGTIS